jgi:hypothetical protein
MPRARLSFRKAEVKRAVAAARQAGLNVAKVKISPAGDIEIVTTEDPSAAAPKNPWDKYYENPPQFRKRVQGSSR